MKNGERKIWKRLLRRIESARGSAYFEFCIFVPILLVTFLFAADFTRVLYAEQQVEIASRVLCDIESHLKPGARDVAGRGENSGCPGAPGKRVVRKYLADALKNEGLFVRDSTGEGSVYCKGRYYRQTGILHWIVNDLVRKIMGLESTGSKFVDLMAKIFGGIVELMTLKTTNYLVEIFPTDKVVKTSVSVLICPFSPVSPYTLFGRHDSEGVMLVPSVTPRLGGGIGSYNRDLKKDERVRYYCHMPALDTMPIAPYTFVRQLTRVMSPWIKK